MKDDIVRELYLAKKQLDKIEGLVLNLLKKIKILEEKNNGKA